MKKNDNFTGKELGSAIENKKENYPSIGEWTREKPEVDNDKCIGCEQCLRFCPEGAIKSKIINGKKKISINLEFCKGCKICIEHCPVQALKMKQVVD